MPLCPAAFISAPLTLYLERRRNPMSPTSQHAERLLAHALLCRQIARQSWHEETAAEFEKLAAECVLAAAMAPPTAEPYRHLH